MAGPLVESDRPLAEAVAEPPRWSNVDADGSFRWDDFVGGFNRYGWDQHDQSAFDRYWPNEADAHVDELIADYASMWPWLITHVLRARNPDLVAEVERMAEAREIGRAPTGVSTSDEEGRGGGTEGRERATRDQVGRSRLLGYHLRLTPNDDVVRWVGQFGSTKGPVVLISHLGDSTVYVEGDPGSRSRSRQQAISRAAHRGLVNIEGYEDEPWAPGTSKSIIVSTALLYGPFDHVRARRSWPEAPAFECRVCGALEEGRFLSAWMLKAYGPPSYCRACCIRARTGRVPRQQADVNSGIRRLAEVLERIPAQGVHNESIAWLEQRRRDETMAALIVAPDPERAKQLVKGTWLDVLKASGLIGDAWRSSRGTYCTAADGHPCRSIAERTVDDWLAVRGIGHVPEPMYPASRMRADWLLADGTYVEYAGLAGDPKYDARMDEKRRMARAAGIRLIVLVPEDLGVLGRRLAR